MTSPVVARIIRAALILGAIASSPAVPATAQTPSKGTKPAISKSAPASAAAATDRRSGLAAARKAMDGSGRARIIVEFDPEPARAKLAAGAGDEASRRAAALRTTRAAIMAGLAGTGVSGMKGYERLPLMAMEVEADALDALAKDPTVVGIQLDRQNRPNLADSVGLIDADDLQDRGEIGMGTAVAILDTGIDRFHPFFAGRIVAEACFSTTTRSIESSCPFGLESGEGPGSAAPCASFDCDHGTHVAGIATGSGQARSGVAPGTDVIAIQVFSDAFVDCGAEPVPCSTAFDSDILMGLDHVLALSDDFEIAAANLSLGGGRFVAPCDAQLPAYRAAIEALRARGIATVIASGNDFFNGAINAPACVSSAIAVGSTTKSDRVSGFSNHAATVDLLAPGSSITSSLPGGGFGILSGTSMAAPHVAGAIALLKGAEPGATIGEIERSLGATGRAIQRAGISVPRIDVERALAQLRTGDLPAPTNDLLADAVRLRGSIGTVQGTNIDASKQAREPMHAGVAGGASVWWRWRPPVSGEALITTAGSTFDTVLAVYRGGRISRLREVASNDDAPSLALRSAVSFTANSNRTYRIAVDGFGGAVGDITLNFSVARAELAGADRFGQAPRLRGRSGVAFGSTIGASAQRNEPVHAGVGGGKSIWWRWRAPATGDVTFETTGSDFDTVLAVYRGGRLARLREVASNDDPPSGFLQSAVTFRARRNRTYRIAVDGFGGAEGRVVLTYAPDVATRPTLAQR